MTFFDLAANKKGTFHKRNFQQPQYAEPNLISRVHLASLGEKTCSAEAGE